MKKVIILTGLIIVLATVPMASFAQSVIAADQAEQMPLNLDGSNWVTEMTLVDKGGKKTTTSDTLTFEKNQFFSENFRSKGYEPTNYSVSLNGDGSTKFGTMQIKDGETVYWEGRVKEDTIDGSIYLYSKKAKGVKEEYYFSGKISSSGALKQKKRITSFAEKVVIPQPTLKSNEEQVEPPLAGEESAIPEITEEEPQIPQDK